MALVAAPAVTMLTPSVAFAQDFTTGTLSGTVTNTAGQPISGATVTVTQNGRAQSRTLTTDAMGRFRASQIPVGGYTVSIASAGYETYTDSNVRVTLGGAADFQFTIGAVGGSASSVDDVVVVGTRSASIDFDRTTTGITVDVQETFDRIPTQRNLAAIQLLAPSTSQGDGAFGNQISIAGSSVAENVYYVNGFNITNFRTFVGGNTVPFEFYQQIDVKTGGYQAEFGRSTGGAVIAVTRSGSDEFHGGLNYYIEPSSLEDSAPDTWVGPGSQLNLDSQNSTDRSEANVWLSGPILRDHIYFFGFYNWRDFETGSVDTSGTIQTATQDDPFYGGKLDFYLNPDHRLELTYFSDDQTQVINQRFASGDAANTFNFAGGETKIAKYTGRFTDWFTLSALYGEGSFNQTVSGDLDSEVSVVDLGLNTIRGNPALLIATGDDSRKMYRVDADIYINDFFGDHHFRIGYDREDLHSASFQSYSGGNYIRYYQAGAGGALSGLIPANELYVRDRVYLSGGEYKTEQTAFYIQDAWDVTDRLSLQLGLRAEKFANSNAAGEIFVETDYDLSPRLGFTYDLFGDRSTSVKGFYGRYYIPIAANTNIRMAGNELFTEDYYRITNIAGSNPATAAGLTACLNASPRNNCLPTFNGGPVLSNVFSPGVVPDAASLVSQNLEAQYQDEFILGIEHEVSGMGMFDGWTIGANYVFRDLKKVMEDFDTSWIIDNYCAYAGISPANCGAINGSGYVLVNPGSDLIITPDASTFPFLAGQTITIPAAILDIPEATRTYKALELTAERPWDGRWSLRMSAVFAESKGNIEGGVKSDNGQADTGLTQDFDEPGWTDGSYGYLPNHRGQTYKVFGSYALTEDITLGANAILQSPRKYGCIGSYPLGDGRASPTTMTAWYCNGVMTPRGSQFEGEWYKNVDLSASWNLPLTGIPGRVQLRADIFNIFDFEGARDFVEVGDQAPGTPNADYGRISSYQTPRFVRLGLSYQF
ncbi:MAG TPA: TonB-dependent receptor [Brevundimonas sp.]|uniref:TonB-dependent receptor n=1 Tax=Brevundimonas sp. TaxID=1871086 RepID=UPI00261B6DA1|nr:TonB-dependent receptor [Brevundimonas sp.]HRO34180.1 TonB-dependent receptor [Brevundimonas sp.]